MRQSIRIIKQCLENMPAGPYKADHPLTVSAAQGRTLQAHRNPDHALPERVVGPGHAGR
jgi:NADH:ubiquinone oxidoreductase subunit D